MGPLQGVFRFLYDLTLNGPEIEKIIRYLNDLKNNQSEDGFKNSTPKNK